MIHIAHADSLPELRETFAELPGHAENKHELFAELASALALPHYFGNNWDAFEECLGDLDAPPDLVVRNARALWERLPREMMLLADIWLDRLPHATLVFVW
ncbi:MAG: barstar family protein [Thermoanaerobaculia bacterium]